MDRAIHKETGNIITAFEIVLNSSYQNAYNEKWIAPSDSIQNWDELDKKGIKEIAVHPVKSSNYTNWRGTEIFCSPCFAVYPNSPGKTVFESPIHKMLKNWLFNHLKNNDLKLVYTTVNKTNKHKNYIQLNDLKEKIDWNNYDIEVHISSLKRLRADILLPFKNKDRLLGNGIDFEIQLKEQEEETRNDRSIKWALGGYSVVWLHKKDFYFNEDETDIELRNKEPEIYTYQQQLYFGGKDFVKNLKTEVINQSKLLDYKLDKITYEITNSITNAYKVKDEINKKMDGFSNSLIDIKLNDIIKELEQKIDYDVVILEIKNKIENNFKAELKSYKLYKEIISNPPLCPECKIPFKIKNGKYGYFWTCVNYPNCRRTQPIPQKIKDELREIW